ncbi:MAG: MBL fold metallo-hydrolase [Calothrix sp. SM1_5_4]|nr:MBL fold metallo-hydrolase [Calothrix sp. SM1_5_4]
MARKLWGVRGSLPTPLTPDRVRSRLEDVLSQYEELRDSGARISARDFLETLPPHLLGGYGGNTSCGEITSGKSRLVVDGGSGLRGFSEQMLKSEPDLDNFHIYLTHFHWDHLIGLPFFSQLYMKGRTVHFYAVHEDVEESIRTLFKKPNFPVPYEVIQKQVKIHRVEPYVPFSVGELQVTPYRLDHPDPCWGARVEHGGKSLAWAVDTEGIRTSKEELGRDAGLYHRADLLVFDAQYSFGEALEKINWGHSSGPVGIDLAIREDVRRAVFMHHDPSALDEAIRRAEEETQNYYEELLRARKRSGMKPPHLRWHFAREGEIIEV